MDHPGLPKMALDAIEKQPRIVGNPFVFPGRGERAFASFGRGKEKLDTKLETTLPRADRWVIHDLRRTARSLMSRAGVRPDIAERVLGHAIPGVEGVYDRHSYAEEKAEALGKLAALVDRIVKPALDNVVEFPQQAVASRNL